MIPRAAILIARLAATVDAAQADYDAAHAEDPDGERTRQLRHALARAMAEHDMLLDEEAERRRRGA